MKERLDKTRHPLSTGLPITAFLRYFSRHVRFCVLALGNFQNFPDNVKLYIFMDKRIFGINSSVNIPEISASTIRIISQLDYMGGKLVKEPKSFLCPMPLEVILYNLFHYLAINFHLLIWVHCKTDNY